jgi:uncharacterized DUF497 family protein
MKIEFDPKKSQKNFKERGLPFEWVEKLDWETSVTSQDERYPYPEPRFIAMGYLGERLHIICFTPIDSKTLRVISFKKANKREGIKYEEETTNQ